MARARLGEILVEAGIIDSSQLDAALAERAQADRPLGMTLVRLGYLDEDTLIKTLARQLQLPMARLHGKRVPDDVLDLVPLELADKNRCFPLFIKGEGSEKRLFVAMEDPARSDTAEELSRYAGLPIQPVLVAPSEIEEALHRHYDLTAEVGSSASPLSASGEPPVGESRLDPLSDTPSPLEPLAQGSNLEAPPDFGDDSLDEASSEMLTFDPSTLADPREPVEGVPQVAILRALTQLLIQKGVFTREELIERVHALASPDESDLEP